MRYASFMAFLIFASAALSPGSARAACLCCDCVSEQLNHMETRREINEHISNDFFEKLREEYLLKDFFEDLWEPAFQEKTDQATVLETQLKQSESTVRDAEQGNNVAQTMGRLNAEFAREAVPSELLGSIITFARGLSESTHNSLTNALRGTQITVDRALAGEGTREARGLGQVNAWRLEQLQDIYLDKVPDDSVISGKATEPDRVNNDIDAGRTLLDRLTLDIDFSDNTTTKDERDILALKENLMPSAAMDMAVDADLRSIRGQVEMNDRMALAAKRALVDRTFQAIVAGRAKGSAATPEQLRQALLNLGFPEDSQIVKDMSGHPSYEAHMAVLTRHLFADPNIYPNLVDNEANLRRVMIAQEATGLMQTVDLYHSMERSEALTALWAWLEATKRQEALDARKN